MAEKYKFYLQKYPDGDGNHAKVEITEHYKCLYKQFKDFAFAGDTKNVYAENFAEKSGDRIWTPENPEDLAFSSYDCTLELLFKEDTCQADVRAFYEDIRGRKVEYSDTFRNKYVSLILIKHPTIQQEILYGERKYMLVSFTFNNFLGDTFTTSQIK